MTKQLPTTVLDVSKGLGYGLLYNPVIGQVASSHYPLIKRIRRPGIKKTLV